MAANPDQALAAMQAAVAAMATQITALTTAMQGQVQPVFPTAQELAAAMPAPIAPAAPNAPIFQLTPGQQGGNFIDYNTPYGLRLFQAAVAAPSVLFDGADDNRDMFLNDLQVRSDSYNWASVFTIPVVVTDGNPAIDLDLLTQYGQIPIASVMTHFATYSNNQDRNLAQRSRQIAEYLANALNAKLKARLRLRRREYTNDTGTISGAGMLKTILSVVTIETRSTVSCLRNDMDKLEDEFETLEWNVTKLNAHIESKLDEFAARGVEFDGLLHKLFAAYLACPDQEFKSYVKEKQTKWEEGSIDLEPREFANQVELKYKTMIQKETYMAPTDTDVRLMALTAQLDRMRNRRSSTTGRGGGDKDKSSRGSTRGNDDSDPYTGEWAWKKVAPTDEQQKTKKFRGKDYVYCPYHGNLKWVLAKSHVATARRQVAMMMLRKRRKIRQRRKNRRSSRRSNSSHMLLHSPL